MQSSAEIRLTSLSKAYAGTTVVDALSAEITPGAFTVILGPSGCGKSTLLNMIAGLESTDQGEIWIAGRAVQSLAPKDRGCAMVFQNYALYPHMSVAENIGYPLKVAGAPKAERRQRIEAVAKTVDLSDLLDRRPSALSGGQRQRVAIARAIIRQPKVLLFDEPLSNLDARLRHEMRRELAELHRRIGATSVFVTHDQVEAMTLADQIMVLNHGRIEQFGTPQEIYHRPASRFVAEFIGAPPMNLINAVSAEGRLRLPTGQAIAEPLSGPLADGAHLLGVRPEQLVLGPEGVAAKAVYREDLGSHVVVTAALPDGQLIRIATPLPVQVGEEIGVHFPEPQLHLFDPKSGARRA